MSPGEQQRPYVTTWGDVLQHLATLTAADMVCFERPPRDPAEECLVADVDELDDDEDVPAEAERRGWTTALLKDQIEDILINLDQQVDAPGRAQQFEAIAYYVENDAFITIT